MNGKCEWKVVQIGDKPARWKFYPCDNLEISSSMDMAEDLILFEMVEIWFCPFCGADIRKPEDNHCKYRGSIIAGKPQCSRGNECISVSYKCNIYEPGLVEPLIVKSGGTYVAHCDGINYLCLSPGGFDIKTYNKRDDIIEVLKWEGFKPFSEIEKEGLTDEIAKLRPMIHIQDKTDLQKDIRKLTYIDKSLIQCKAVIYFKENIRIRLATPHELQESEK